MDAGRDKKDKAGARGGRSLRWIEGYERIAEMAARLPTTRLVYVADREADLVPLMPRAQGAANIAPDNEHKSKTA